MNTDHYHTCVEVYSDRVYRFLISRGSQVADAKDAVQHAYTILWQQRERVVFNKAKAFLFTVALRYTIDAYRKNSKVANVAVINEEKFVLPNNPDTWQHINKALQQLPNIQRTLILLRDLEGYSYADMASITELSEQQVKVYLFRARKKIRQYLGSMEEILG